jgi:hypothetical protein
MAEARTTPTEDVAATYISNAEHPIRDLLINLIPMLYGGAGRTIGATDTGGLIPGNFALFGTSGNGGIVAPDDLTDLEFWSDGGDPNAFDPPGSQQREQ